MIVDVGPGEGPDAGGGRAAGRGGGGVVARAGLFGRLGGPARVTVVSAPPGSGKTVLLRSWIAWAGLADCAAWVPVGRQEREPQRFWLSVLGALRRTAAGAALAPTAGPRPSPAPATSACSRPPPGANAPRPPASTPAGGIDTCDVFVDTRTQPVPAHAEGTGWPCVTSRGGGGSRTRVLQYLTRASPGAACLLISQPRRSCRPAAERAQPLLGVPPGPAAGLDGGSS